MGLVTMRDTKPIYEGSSYPHRRSSKCAWSESGVFLRSKTRKLIETTLLRYCMIMHLIGKITLKLLNNTAK